MFQSGGSASPCAQHAHGHMCTHFDDVNRKEKGISFAAICSLACATPSVLFLFLFAGAFNVYEWETENRFRKYGLTETTRKRNDRFREISMPVEPVISVLKSQASYSKLLILKYLDISSLLKLGAVSKSFYTLVKDPWLWRRKYLLHWTKKEDNSLSQNWYEQYRAEYKRRKDLRDRLRRMTPIMPQHPLFSRAPQFPGIGLVPPYGGGIIGGDFDLNPNFGFADPLFPGSGRRIFPDRVPHPLRPDFDPMSPDPDIGLQFGPGHAPGPVPRFGRGRHFGGMQPRFL